MSDNKTSLELKALRDKCLLFNNFMSEKWGLPPLMAKAYKESNRLIETAYLEGKIKPLKAMSSDIDNEVLRHMPLHLAEELKRLFKEKLDIDYNVVDLTRIKAINKIYKKGKITKLDEYMLLLNWVEEIYEDSSKKEEIKRINELLSSYKEK